MTGSGRFAARLVVPGDGAAVEDGGIAVAVSVAAVAVSVSVAGFIVVRTGDGEARAKRPTARTSHRGGRFRCRHRF